MELRHLRYFVAVAELQNVTRAAARLHVSQPPLTRQIRDLEDELGVALFARTGKALRLTTAGTVFLDEARAVLARTDAAVAAVRAAGRGGQGELQVGYAPSPTAGLLPAALARLRRQRPGLRVQLHDMSSPEMLAGLRDRRLQVTLMMQPPRAALAGVVFEALRELPLVVAVAPTHPLANRRRLARDEIAAEPLVALARHDYPDYQAMLARALGVPVGRLRVAEECDGGMSLVAAVEAGKGVAVVVAGLADMAGRRLRYVPLAPAVFAAVGVAYLRGPLTPATEAFVAALKEAR